MAKSESASRISRTALGFRASDFFRISDFGFSKMAYLELKNVSKSFGANGSCAEVLRGINLAVEKGEFVAIVGFSGAGKTTLISLIAGLLRPDVGTLTLNDLEITEPGPD